MVVEQPLQEGHALGQLLDRDRRRVATIGLDRIEHPALHRPPVQHRGADIGQGALELLLQPLALRLADDAGHLDIHEAFAHPAFGGAAGLEHLDQLAPGVAADRNDRVEHEQDRVTELVQDVERRIDEERHVVIGDLDGRHRVPVAIAGCRRQPDLGPSRHPVAEKAIGPRRDSLEIFGAVGREIVLRRAGEELAAECGEARIGPPDPFAGSHRCAHFSVHLVPRQTSVNALLVSVR